MLEAGSQRLVAVFCWVCTEYLVWFRRASGEGVRTLAQVHAAKEELQPHFEQQHSRPSRTA